MARAVALSALLASGGLPVGGILATRPATAQDATPSPAGTMRSPAATGSSAGTTRNSSGGASSPPRSPAAPGPAPRGYLIHTIDGGDPIVVKRYIEEGDQIRFEKFGGWVGIPKSEVLKIVPDLPDTQSAVALPPAPPGPPEGGPTPGAPAPDPADQDRLYLTTRGGASLQALSVVAEGDRLRVRVDDGSFTLARTDVVGIVRIPRVAGQPEAWLTVLATEATSGAAGGGQAEVAPASGAKSAKAPGARGTSGANGRPTGSPRDPGPTAPPAMGRGEGPHLLRLANGQVFRIEGFWIEGREIRFQRLGGMVGLALDEVARLIPEDLASVNGRTPVRYRSQLGPDLLEVEVRSGPQRVRLIGIETLPDVRTGDDPWQTLSRGIVVYLEFDRQRYDRAGDWLAYLFMPNGRMLNAELIRVGLARPRPDGRNLRYLDLFQELAPPPGSSN